MPSTLTWLDVSAEQQRRVRDMIRLFEEPGTRDELGVGPVRDAFSELLFPGTSVIQTRARYFLFVPWYFQEAQRRGLRNLTNDASWDALLRLDGAPEGGPLASNRPLADLVRWCTANAVRRLDDTRLSSIESLVESVRRHLRAAGRTRGERAASRLARSRIRSCSQCASRAVRSKPPVSSFGNRCGTGGRVGCQELARLVASSSPSSAEPAPIEATVRGFIEDESTPRRSRPLQ